MNDYYDNYTGPHATGSDAANRARKQEKQFEENRKLKEEIPLAYAADGSIVFGKQTLRHKENPEEDNRPELPIVTLATETPDKELEFFWQDRFPYQFGLICGRQGLGKSFFTCYLAAQLTNANVTQWVDGRPCPTGAAMFFVSEGGNSETGRRIKNMNGDLSKVAFYNGVGKGRKRPDGSLDIDIDPLLTDLVNLEKAIDAAERQTGEKVKLLVIDPLTDFMGNTKQNDAGEVTAVLRGLDYLAAERNICIIGVKHPNKSINTTSSVYNVGGSVAFTTKPRWVYLLDQLPETRQAIIESGDDTDKHVILAWSKVNDFEIRNSIEFHLLKNNNGNVTVEILDANGRWNADQLLYELATVNSLKAHKGASRKEANYRAVLEAFNNGITSPKQISEQNNIPIATVNRYLKDIRTGRADKDGYHIDVDNFWGNGETIKEFDAYQ